MIVVGLMSGTSMDGLDAAVAELDWDGDQVSLRPLGSRETPWPSEVRSRLLGLLPPHRVDLGEVCDVDTLIGQASAAAVTRALEEFAGGRGDLVASHGQTVFHRIIDGKAAGTLQLGQPAWITEATGLPVVSDLRARDIAAGGQGAPLASLMDGLLLAPAAAGGTQIALNLGGIANISVVTQSQVLAYDTGPANCLIDVAVERATAGVQTFDDGGALAASGTVDVALLRDFLAEPYYLAAPPKSTGRELFTADYLDATVAGRDIAPADLVATLTELTAVTVARACAGHRPRVVVASGGGVHNATLMAALRRHLPGVRITTIDELGIPSGAKEAYLMALIGFLTWHQVPGILPGATGSGTPRVLGRVTAGDRPRALGSPRAVRGLRILHD
ncbi:anhydro-N-acetylmuramic acid kinase [Dermacoccaceae bacterium W4C1]